MTVAVMMPHGTEARVCAMISQRQAFAMAKYGVSVRDNPLNLRQWLHHALEESLDQAIYLMRAIEELDGAAAVDDTLSAALDYEAHKDADKALSAGLMQARIGGVK